MIVKFTVPGEPVGKQRPRVNTFTRKAYTPEKTESYESWVRMCYLQDYKDTKFPDDAFLCITIQAFFDMPKSVSNVKKQKMIKGQIRPTKKPDLDNIEKAICDALNSIAYKDDSAIVSAYITKRYTDINPRVVVIISDEGMVM
jgi:Holliday junction resolvase RusA-like endonuclease